MSRSSLIAIGLAVVAVPIIALQYSENSKLKEESKELKGSKGIGVGSTRNGAGSRGRGESSEGGGKEVLPGSVAFQSGSLEGILSNTDPLARARELIAFAEGLRAEDIALALAELRESVADFGPDEQILAHLLLTRWTQEDPDAALASLKDGNPKRDYRSAISIAGALAAYDPERAAAWLADKENTLVQHHWMSQSLAATVAKTWMAQDPDAALAWARTLPKEQRAGAYGGLIGTLAANDPKQASELALSLEAGDARRHALGEIAEVWARKAPVEAAAWAQSLEGEDRHRVTRETVEIWAREDAVEAAKFLDGTAEDERGRYLTSVAGSWAREDAPEAAAWVATQPEGDGKNSAMGHVMWTWTRGDPESAGIWIGTQPDGAARDQGIAGLAKAANEFDPQSALDWAITIGNDRMREDSVNHGLRQWHRQNPTAAQEWAQANQVEIPKEDDRPRNSDRAGK